jgi:hypothetical protein
MKQFLYLLAMLLVPLLVGCVPVRGTVTYFYDGSPPSKGASVHVAPQGDQSRTLEWDVYKLQLETQMSNAGFRVIHDGLADYIVTVAYSIDAEGETRTTTAPIYQNGQVSGIRNVTSQVHQRVLIVRFFDPNRVSDPGARPAAEVRVLSEGSSSELAKVMPALAKIAFSKWPGKEGKTYTVSAPL